MPTEVTSLTKLQALESQIANLRDEALQELKNRRADLLQELDGIETQMAGLNGKAAGGAAGRGRKRSTGSMGKSVPLQELKEMLASAPGKTVSVRQEGLDLKNVKTLAAANPTLLRMGGKGPWPTVTLLK